MISKNQELVKAEARVQTLTQKIEFRDKGKRGRYVAELIKAKAERDKILFSVTNDSVETKELTLYALEVKEKAEALEKDPNELKKKLDKLSLFMDYMENGIPKWADSHERTPEPNYEQIAYRMKKERKVEAKLTKAQTDFDSAKYKSEHSPKIYSGKYTSELTQTRNNLNSALKKVEQLPSLIEFYQLRAEIDWLIIVAKELEEELAFNQIEITKAETVLGV